MGMCKGCNETFFPNEMINGYCKDCNENSENNKQIIECKKCKTINKITSNFCKHCGEKFEKDYLINSICLETINGVATKIFNKGTYIPCKRTQIFSTAEDNQVAVTIHINQGESELSNENISLAIFELNNIRQAPRGVPQIEVTFEVTNEGYIEVSAKDLDTGSINKISTKNEDGQKIDKVYINQVRETKVEEKIIEGSKSNKKVLDENSKFSNKKENKDSNADELLKWAELLEKGLIDKEDFEKKKRELI